jgi:hypothetical protein
MPVSERRMVNKAEAVGNSSGSVAGEQRLLEAGMGSRGLRRHNANQITDGGDDIRRKSTQNVTVTQIAVRRKTRNYEFCLSIVEPAYRVLLPEGGKNKTKRGGGRRVAGLQRLRQGLNRGGGGGGRLRGSRLIHLHHCIA